VPNRWSFSKPQSLLAITRRGSLIAVPYCQQACGIAPLADLGSVAGSMSHQTAKMKTEDLIIFSGPGLQQ